MRELNTDGNRGPKRPALRLPLLAAGVALLLTGLVGCYYYPEDFGYAPPGYYQGPPHGSSYRPSYGPGYGYGPQPKHKYPKYKQPKYPKYKKYKHHKH